MITLGRSARPAHVLGDEAELGRRGISVERASRGGDVTYHGPGQLVGYPIVRLDRGVVAHFHAMAEGLIEVLAGLGVAAEWRRHAPGLWVRGAAGDAKICAFGVNVQHRVAIHGFALNSTVDLAAFGLIVPCGLAGAAVTSIERLIGRPPSIDELAMRVAAAFGRSFGRAFARDLSPAHDGVSASIGDPIGDRSGGSITDRF